MQMYRELLLGRDPIPVRYLFDIHCVRKGVGVAAVVGDGEGDVVGTGGSKGVLRGEAGGIRLAIAVEVPLVGDDLSVKVEGVGSIKLDDFTRYGLLRQIGEVSRRRQIR